MSNMSYCRFRNTLHDLQDCYDNMDQDDSELSEEEREAREKLIVLCSEIVSDYAGM
jgi:hypothetical protein